MVLAIKKISSCTGFSSVCRGLVFLCSVAACQANAGSDVLGHLQNSDYREFKIGVIDNSHSGLYCLGNAPVSDPEHLVGVPVNDSFDPGMKRPLVQTIMAPICIVVGTGSMIVAAQWKKTAIDRQKSDSFGTGLNGAFTEIGAGAMLVSGISHLFVGLIMTSIASKRWDEYNRNKSAVSINVNNCITLDIHFTL